MDSHRAGRLSYYAAPGEGRPLVLIHSVNAAASSYEMKPLFEHYRGLRPVYALDLPGYGFSERSPREYTPELFSAAIGEFLQTQIEQPADIVALSLSAEFAARTALEKPGLILSLALISPAGMTRRGSASQQAGQAGTSERLHRIFANPLWGQALFDLIATRSSIRYFLKRSFVGTVPEDFVDYDYATSHQPGAEHVPLYFISGALFTSNAIESLYKKVTQPCLVIYDQDGYTNFEGLPALLESSPNWQARRIAPTRGLPQFERLEDTVKTLDAFWAALG
jgi:pimeloyl-ACP methyl ester carboxylesterase